MRRNGVRARQHAAPIRKIQNVAVLRGRVDTRAAGANLSLQPTLQVTHIDLDGVHYSVRGTAVVRRSVDCRPVYIPRLSFSRIVKVNGIPVVLGNALRGCCRRSCGGKPECPIPCSTNLRLCQRIRSELRGHARSPCCADPRRRSSCKSARSRQRSDLSQ